MNAQRSPFVTVLGWVSFALAVAGVASGIVQAIVLPVLQPESLLRSFEESGMSLPPAMRWLFAHLQSLNGLSTLVSALFAWVSWALVKRREWARLAFIALLALATLGGFAGVALFMRSLEWVAGMDPLAAGEIDPVFARMQAAMRVAGIASAVLLALLHGAIAWRLCTRPIRAEFSRSP